MPGASDVSNVIMWSDPGQCQEELVLAAPVLHQTLAPGPPLVIKTDTKPIIHTGDNNVIITLNDVITITMPWLKSVKLLTSQFIRSVCINNAKSSMGTSLKSTWVRVKILTCRNFVTHIVIFTAYPGLSHLLSIDKTSIQNGIKWRRVIQSTINSHMIVEIGLINSPSSCKSDHNTRQIRILFWFHNFSVFMYSLVWVWVVVLRKEKSPIQVELPQNS